MRGRVTRRCGCTYVDDTGKRKQYGDRCPKLRRADGGWNTRHGSWYAIYTVESRGRSKRIVRGGFETSGAAHDHMDQARGKVARGVDMERERLTVKQFLAEWLANKTDVRPTTLRSYEGHVKRYFIPELGWLRMDQLRASHIADMLTKVKATSATKQRVRATLRSALSDAVREGLILSNPATHVRVPSGKRPRALVWTPELEAEYAHTGRKPSPVTIWRPDQLGAFLDAISDHRLYAYFHLLAYRGLRRGEGLGLEWSDLALDAPSPYLTVRRQIVSLKGRLEEGPVKSDAGERTVSLDPGTVTVLRAHRRAQRLERLRVGERWTDTRKVFTDELGAWLDPAAVGKTFRGLVEEAGLVPTRLHDLRHGAASLILASGGTLKDAQTVLGHSSMMLTANTYSHLHAEQLAASAAAAAAIVPRQAQV